MSVDIRRRLEENQAALVRVELSLRERKGWYRELAEGRRTELQASIARDEELLSKG